MHPLTSKYIINSMKSGRRLLIFLAGLIFIGPSAGAIEFTYKYTAGDMYRIISTVNADMYLNRILSFRAETINRISVEVSDVIGDRALHRAILQAGQKTLPIAEAGLSLPVRHYEWDRDYFTEFEQDRLGFMTVAEEFFKPMVRDVPVFPDRSLNIGDTWSAYGVEVHDFRDSFGIEEPLHLPFIANYEYLGERDWKGISFHAFSVSYRIFDEPDEAVGLVSPTRIQGGSDQIIYWDLELGQVAAYEEYFRTIFTLSDGQIWEFRGRAEAEVIEAMPMNREEVAREIAEVISDIPDATVRVSEAGVVISFENIQFAADSAVLLPSERPKLDILA